MNRTDLTHSLLSHKLHLIDFVGSFKIHEITRQQFRVLVFPGLKITSRRHRMGYVGATYTSQPSSTRLSLKNISKTTYPRLRNPRDMTRIPRE
jgi:hypothetical protein